MQWSLFPLILMGHYSFFTCHLYEYHFIGENKTWHEAQLYCREKYTDLATVYDMTDMKRLNDSVKTPPEAWIGLYNETGEEKRKWRWSLPGVDFSINKTNWANDEPNDAGQNGALENCVQVMGNQKWQDHECSDEQEFICYNESSSDKFHWISNVKKTWPQAQSYCREHHTDLVSGDQLEDERIKNNPVTNWWIGLFRDTWRWSDGSNSSFRHWDQDLFKVGHEDKECAFLKTSGKWDSVNCTNKKPFLCYEDHLILIKQNKTWVEALYFCRKNHHDLVSITNLHQQRWVQQRAKKASSPYVWLGMRYTCTLGFWFWVSDEKGDYRNWDSDEETDNCDMSGAIQRGGQYKWFKKNDNDKFNFICSKF
ncbi:C-type mannose receptor 2-like [Trachinotus anak]|uniref:C-type mannose receptor 2-like n=1 Tax=Trachinotus anak TaxID=443729 RepID=UPI0039F18805